MRFSLQQAIGRTVWRGPGGGASWQKVWNGNFPCRTALHSRAFAAKAFEVQAVTASPSAAPIKKWKEKPKRFVANNFINPVTPATTSIKYWKSRPKTILPADDDEAAENTSLKTFDVLDPIQRQQQQQTAMDALLEGRTKGDEGGEALPQKLFYTKPTLVTLPDGRQIAAFNTGHHPKLKPRIVARRIANLRTYTKTERSIRGSHWKLNLICKFVAGMPLEEAIEQLKYTKKKLSPLVSKVLARTANLADIRDGIQYSALEVAECFATRATPFKRLKFHGRGRFGRMELGHTHLRVVIREIDFQLKIYQASTLEEKQKWYELQQKAEQDATEKAAEREEMERLERENARKAEERAKREKK